MKVGFIGKLFIGHLERYDLHSEGATIQERSQTLRTVSRYGQIFLEIFQ